MTNIATALIVGSTVTGGVLLGQAVSSNTPIPIGDAVKIGAAAVTFALWANNKLNRIERRHAKRLDKVDKSLLELASSLDGLPCHILKGDCKLATSAKMLEKVQALLNEETTTTEKE